MSRHTPGPWVATETQRFIPVVQDAQGKGICQFDWRERGRRAADARLIAAAPALLVALQKAVRYGGLYPDLQAEALAVIAKATEVQP